MFANDHHTDHDLALFAELGINPDSAEPRKRSVQCTLCPPGAPTTWNRSGLCDAHDDTAERHLVRTRAVTSAACSSPS